MQIRILSSRQRHRDECSSSKREPVTSPLSFAPPIDIPCRLVTSRWFSLSTSPLLALELSMQLSPPRIRIVPANPPAPPALPPPAMKGPERLGTN
eukprot:484376-Hanusia_phi.AAC.1